MTFTRGQLADPTSLNSIKALQDMQDVIDTGLLNPSERRELLQILSADPGFKADNRDLLTQLAFQIRREEAVQLRYGSVPAPPVPKFFRDVTETRASLKERLDAGLLTNFAVDGKHDPQTTLSLLYWLWKYSNEKRPGTELRLLLPVAGGTGTSTLPVLLRWDAELVGTVRLVSAQPKPVSGAEKMTLAAIKGTLEGAFGITVQNSADWTSAQLGRFLLAVQLVEKLDPHALAALSGTVLAFTTLPEPSGANDEEAHFTWDQASEADGTFLVRSEAFTSDGYEFIGSDEGDLSCPSTRNAAHEIGHAVENDRYRRAERSRFRADRLHTVKFRAFGAARDVYQEAILVANARVEQTHRESVPKYTAGAAELKELVRDAARFLSGRRRCAQRNRPGDG